MENPFHVSYTKGDDGSSLGVSQVGMSEIAGPGPAFSDITRPAPEGAGPARVAALSGKNPFHVHPWITVSLRVRDTCSKGAVVGGRNKTAKSHKRRGVARRCVRNGSPAVSLSTSETWLPSPMERTPHAPQGELRPNISKGPVIINSTRLRVRSHMRHGKGFPLTVKKLRDGHLDLLDRAN